jgi:hypothetical protein
MIIYLVEAGFECDWKNFTMSSGAKAGNWWVPG